MSVVSCQQQQQQHHCSIVSSSVSAGRTVPMRRHCCRWPYVAVITVLIVSFVACLATVALQRLLLSSPPLLDRRRGVADEPGPGDGDLASGDRGTQGANGKQRQRARHQRTSTRDDHQRRGHIQRTGASSIVIYLMCRCTVLLLTSNKLL